MDSATTPAAEPAETPTRTDKRKARLERNRNRALAACRQLMCAGNFRPSMIEVAKHSACSLRSVFDYFTDLEAMHREALDDATAGVIAGLCIQPPPPPCFRSAAIVHAAVFGRPLPPPAT